jgi:hypothetical protein
MSGAAPLPYSRAPHREEGSVGSVAAVVNAVVDALAPLGMRHLDMPATPPRVWAAIAGAKTAPPHCEDLMMV